MIPRLTLPLSRYCWLCACHQREQPYLDRTAYVTHVSMSMPIHICYVYLNAVLSVSRVTARRASGACALLSCLSRPEALGSSPELVVGHGRHWPPAGVMRGNDDPATMREAPCVLSFCGRKNQNNGKLVTPDRTALPHDRQAPCARVSLHTCPAPTVMIQRSIPQKRPARVRASPSNATAAQGENELACEIGSLP